MEDKIELLKDTNPIAYNELIEITPETGIYNYTRDNIPNYCTHYYGEWRCPSGKHTWHSEIKYRAYKETDSGCPICQILGNLIPKLKEEWDKDNLMPIEQVQLNLKNDYEFNFTCKKCGMKYKETMENQLIRFRRETENDLCPYCKGYLPLPGESLEDKYPKISSKWHKTLNKKPANQIVPNSRSSGYFLCNDCGVTYINGVKDEIEKESCEFCDAGITASISKKIYEGYWLRIQVNKYINPNQKAKERYKCPDCGIVHNVSPFDIFHGLYNCTSCNGREAIPGKNTFYIKYKELMKEWEKRNNFIICNPDKILGNSTAKVWWKCNVCNYTYRMSPKNRIYYEKRHMKACPYCKGLRQIRTHFF